MAQDFEELTFIDLIKVITDNKTIVIAITAVVLLTAVIYSVAATKVYRAEVMIAPADEIASSGAGLSSIMSRIGSIPGLGGFSRMARQDKMTQAIVTLSSPKFMMDFIRDNNLLPVLFANKWDAEAREWAVDDPEDIPSLSDGYVLFEKNVLEVTEEDTGMVTVAIKWSDAERAAAWANQLVQRINQNLRSRAIDEANRTIEYLNSEVEKTLIVEVRQAIYFMIESQINMRTMANVREEYAFKVISPAYPPERDRFVEPNRFLILIGAVVLGPVFGIFACFLLFALKKIRVELSAARD
ncbi:MAG: Wzz/FepE/Etk N-terminal domain-containing protein [Gammaproteobacteria bacterium]|nr:Wzz/FepE/Etk N-terminal domain-containing protein [Gammaproteobacteria bacterium]